MLDKFFILLHAENHSKISPGTLLGGPCLCLRYYTTLIC